MSEWDAVGSRTKEAIGRALERVDARVDHAARLAADPVGAVHARYRRPRDVEIAALVAACLAFGNAKALRAKVDEAFDRLGPGPARLADDELEVFARLGGFRHRVYVGEDVARLVIGARRIQRSSGSLGARFRDELGRCGTLRDALASWAREVRAAGGLDRAGRPGAAHLLPDPAKTSGCKRLLLYLRWMVRPADGVDLGVWSRLVSAEVLLCPVDTHIHRLALNLGFTRSKTASWKTAEEVTRALRSFDAADPTRFDFALCHLGMLQRCPSRRDEARCEGCGVKAVCRHWGRRAP